MRRYESERCVWGKRDLSLAEPCGCLVGANADDQLALRGSSPFGKEIRKHTRSVSLESHS